MTAATEAIKQRKQETREQALNHYIEHFIKKYGPEDPYENSQFHMELHHIVRMIYITAQEPILDRYTQLAMSIPMPFGIPQP